ncbi:MAG: MinD/ParA family protein [Desulfatiglandaceae bacterium]
MSRTIAITSGKGGVGKTNISLNLALCLARQGHRTCLFDADFGLANINILLGLQPEYDLKDVIFNDKTLPDIIIKTEENVDILPGSSGLEELADLDTAQMEALIQSLSEMAGYDFLIFDTSAGISRNVITLCLASPEIVLVITPEPTSLTDGFALLKVLTLNGFKGEAKIIVNQCKTAETADLIYKKFSSAAMKYLNLDVGALGMIYPDARVVEAVKQQRPFLLLYPDTNAAKCIQKIAEQLLSDASNQMPGSDMTSFWKRLLELIGGPLTLPVKKKGNRETGLSPKAREDGSKAQQAAGTSQAEIASGMAPHGSAVAHTASNQIASQISAVASDGQAEATHSKRSGPFEEGAFMPLMERLIGSIASVSKEIQQLREAIEGNGNCGPQQNASGSPQPNHVHIKPIRLDFEAYVESRNTTRKES